jgi:hypothetical protein
MADESNGAGLAADAQHILEARLQIDEDRLRADEARMAADERLLRANRLVARIAIVLAGTLIIAVAGLTVSLFALNRNIETVAKAAPKDDSVGPAALKVGAVTASKIAPGSVSTDAIAAAGVRRADIAPGAVGGAQIAVGSVTRGDVRHDTLTGAQIDEGTLRHVASAQTTAHAVTASDAQALGGVSSSSYVSRITVVRAATPASRQRTKGPVAARCPSGMRVVSGGAAVDGTSHGVAIARSAPDAGESWTAVANSYRAPTVPWRLLVTAICVTGGSR